MFDIGLPEMLVLVVVTLLVVGPKDLPRVIRGFARAVAKMRRMVEEFLGSVNDYVRESELAEFKEAMDKTREAMDVRGQIDDFIDPTGELKKPVFPPEAGKTAGSAPASSPDSGEKSSPGDNTASDPKADKTS